MALLLLALLLSYLAGSFPTSLIVAKKFRGIDIREHGSGNAGGTNVLRVVGWKAALLVAAVDVGKGALAAGLIWRIAAPAPLDGPSLAAAAGAAAVLGHVFPVFAGFRGGKGVGTAAGVMAVLHPLALAACVPLFAGVVALTRIVSLASVCSALAFPVAVLCIGGPAWVRSNPLPSGIVTALALFIVFTHRSNLKRLLAGTENRFGRTPD